MAKKPNHNYLLNMRFEQKEMLSMEDAERKPKPSSSSSQKGRNKSNSNSNSNSTRSRFTQSSSHATTTPFNGKFHFVLYPKTAKNEKFLFERNNDNILWNFVAFVLYLATEGPDVFENDDNHERCSICLNSFKLPIVTKCGHFFCWPCLLQHMNSESTTSQHCPLCQEFVSRKDLKPLFFHKSHTPTNNALFCGQLLYLPRGSCSPQILPTTSSTTTSSTTTSSTTTTSTTTTSTTSLQEEDEMKQILASCPESCRSTPFLTSPHALFSRVALTTPRQLQMFLAHERRKILHFQALCLQSTATAATTTTAGNEDLSAFDVEFLPFVPDMMARCEETAVENNVLLNDNDNNNNNNGEKKSDKASSTKSNSKSSGNYNNYNNYNMSFAEYSVLIDLLGNKVSNMAQTLGENNNSNNNNNIAVETVPALSMTEVPILYEVSNNNKNNNNGVFVYQSMDGRLRFLHPAHFKCIFAAAYIEALQQQQQQQQQLAMEATEGTSSSSSSLSPSLLLQPLAEQCSIADMVAHLRQSRVSCLRLPSLLLDMPVFDTDTVTITTTTTSSSSSSSLSGGSKALFLKEWLLREGTEVEVASLHTEQLLAHIFNNNNNNSNNNARHVIDKLCRAELSKLQQERQQKQRQRQKQQQQQQHEKLLERYQYEEVREEVQLRQAIERSLVEELRHGPRLGDNNNNNNNNGAQSTTDIDDAVAAVAVGEGVVEKKETSFITVTKMNGHFPTLSAASTTTTTTTTSPVWGKKPTPSATTIVAVASESKTAAGGKKKKKEVLSLLSTNSGRSYR